MLIRACDWLKLEGVRNGLYGIGVRAKVSIRQFYLYYMKIENEERDKQMSNYGIACRI